MTASFTAETTIKAVRKRRPCIGCDKFIEPGEPAVKYAGIVEGDFVSVTYHPECRAAEVALNNDFLDRAWGDDWTPLHDYRDHDAGEWVQANWSLPYQRLNMTRKQWAAHRPSALSTHLPA